MQITAITNTINTTKQYNTNKSNNLASTPNFTGFWDFLPKKNSLRYVKLDSDITIFSPKELKKLRENKGLSTREVYELAKVSNSYLSLVENGHRRASAVVLKKLASVYGVSYLDLYVKAGYADLAEYEKNKNSNFVSKNNIDTEGLDDNDIEELRRFAEFLKNKKKQNKNK